MNNEVKTTNQSENKEVSKLEMLKNSILASNVPQVVMYVISCALDRRSSDIHIEPLDTTVRVRFRVDGVLTEIVEYPNTLHSAVVSRVKIMSNLKIDETRVPQDGRTNVTTKENKEMDLRVSTFPTVNGEKIVMRIQDRSRQIPHYKMLGIKGTALERIERAVDMPNGIILTSGPTGSGKTTTLYSSLQKINREGINILTIEDPVEIQMDGLSQSQVKPDIGYLFATGLRAALRQDPDVIMVGEIRDHETINVAIEAALTGHLVFSTIHTNSAVETLTRIANMGVPNYLIASSVDTIIAQRLVRKLHPKIKVPYTPTEKETKAVKAALAKLSDAEKAHYPDLDFDNPKFFTYDPRYKENQAYYGRVGLYEVLQMTPLLKNALLEGKNSLYLQETAIKEGLVSLEQAGIIAAMQGETTLKEVYRVAREA